MKKQNKISENEDKAFVFRGKYLLLIVLIIYGLFFIGNSQVAQLALHKSGNILMKILPVLLVVVLLTALFNFLLPPK